jgi:hypothetical protein
MALARGDVLPRRAPHHRRPVHLAGEIATRLAPSTALPPCLRSPADRTGVHEHRRGAQHLHELPWVIAMRRFNDRCRSGGMQLSPLASAACECWREPIAAPGTIHHGSFMSMVPRVLPSSLWFRTALGSRSSPPMDRDRRSAPAHTPLAGPQRKAGNRSGTTSRSLPSGNRDPAGAVDPGASNRTSRGGSSSPVQRRPRADLLEELAA